MTEKEKDAIARGAIALGIGIPGVFLRAWCILRMYEWHVQTLFGGPALTLSKVFALWTLLALLRLGEDPPTKVQKDESDLPTYAGRALGKMILFPLACLAFAWWLR